MLNIYEICHADGEKEWCTGSTNIEALSNYLDQTETMLCYMQESEIIEVPQKLWKSLNIDNNLGNGETFYEWMLKHGEGEPEIICGTMY